MEPDRGQPCARPGCAGTIDEDGYCDLCGHAAAPRPSSPTPSPPTPSSGPVPSPAAEPTTAPSGRSRSSVGVLGTGLAELPPVPYRDPDEVILTDPVVPEDRRFCSNPDCGHPVGRGGDGRPGRTEGFCPRDGTPYSFTPKLTEGDLVHGQYEITGCLAYGGLGWIYLAADRNLDGQWVVLKGLLNTGDAEARRAAEAERRFLIDIDHPNIVGVKNYVAHPEPDGGAEHAQHYLVMEYVGGGSLQDMLLRRLRAGEGGLPPRQAIPYTLEILQALGYLHERGTLFCDLKPANVVQVERRLKLIDLGGVRRVDDTDGSVYGTPGYWAPELGTAGASVASDIYTVGRTLAVLCLPFSPSGPGPDGPVENPIPRPEPAEHESLYRVLLRATAADPATRFTDAAEMAEQLTGVLREIRAAEERIPYPAPSTRFGPERGAAGTGLDTAYWRVFPPLDPSEAVAALPAPAVDPADPAAAVLAGLLAPSAVELLAVLDSLAPSPETLLARARVLGERGDPAAEDALAAAGRELGDDWRVRWYRAVYRLAAGAAPEAMALFDQCLGHLPGESAPKLALAAALECAHRPAEAARWYATVWRTDHAFVGAAFGLARTRPEALDVLDQVPASSSHHPAAQLALVAAALRVPEPERLDVARVAAAGRRLGRLTRVEARQRDAMAADVLEAALSCLAGGVAAPEPQLLGAPFTPTGLRAELERVYRRLARTEPTTRGRRFLVDRANAVRPRTWS